MIQKIGKEKGAKVRGDQIKRLSVVCEAIASPLYKAQGFTSSRILVEWAHIVGPALAEICLPERVTFPSNKTTEGRLWVRCSSSTAFQISYQEAQIIERINRYFGYKAISFLKITQIPRLAPSTKKVVLKKKPRDAVQLNLDQLNFESVVDPDLQKALSDLAAAMMQQK